MDPPLPVALPPPSPLGELPPAAGGVADPPPPPEVGGVWWDAPACPFGGGMGMAGESLPPEPTGGLAPGCKPSTGVTEGVNGLAAPAPPPEALSLPALLPPLEHAIRSPKQNNIRAGLSRDVARPSPRSPRLGFESRQGGWLIVFIL